MPKAAPKHDKPLPRSKTERDVLEFLRDYGFVWAHLEFGNDDPVLQALKKHLGRRFRRFYDAWGDYQSGALSPIDFYNLIDDVRWMAIVNSTQSDMTVATYAAFHDFLKRENLGRRARRVLDAGTGSGLMPAWLSEKFPKSTFLGTDAATRLVGAAKALRRGRPGLDFVAWNHAERPPAAVADFDIVLSCLGASASHPGLEYAVDGGDERACTRFAHGIRTWSLHFSAWRNVVAEGGRLAVILRLPHDIDAEAAFVSAARHGWKFDRTASRKVVAGCERVALLVFTTRPRKVGECAFADVSTSTAVAWFRKESGSKVMVKRGGDGWIEIDGFDIVDTLRKISGRSALRPKVRWTLACPDGPAPFSETEVYRCEAGVVGGRAYAWGMSGESGGRIAVVAPDGRVAAARARLARRISGPMRVANVFDECVVDAAR